MKKAEAISILATSVRPREAKDRARYDEAVKMAIEALKRSETPKSSERTAETAQNTSSCAHENDVIFREAAIEALARMMPRSYTPDGSHPADEEIFRAQEVFADCIEALEILPSAAPSTAHTTEKTAPSTDDWIPVERELPEDLAEVNVTWVNHEPEPYYEPIKSKPFTASAVYYEGNWYWYSSVCADVLSEYGRNDVDKVDDAIEITAWKPLPEPYRGGDTK